MTNIVHPLFAGLTVRFSAKLQLFHSAQLFCSEVHGMSQYHVASYDIIHQICI